MGSRNWTHETTFRGEVRTVVVDRYDDDPSVNACEIEWHFEDVTPDGHDALAVTEAEEQRIFEEICQAAYDRYAEDFEP